MPFREATALVVVEREGIIDTRIVTLRDDGLTIELKIDKAWGPNLFVSVLALRGRIRGARRRKATALEAPSTWCARRQSHASRRRSKASRWQVPKWRSRPSMKAGWRCATLALPPQDVVPDAGAAKQISGPVDLPSDAHSVAREAAAEEQGAATATFRRARAKDRIKLAQLVTPAVPVRVLQSTLEHLDGTFASAGCGTGRGAA